MNGPHPRMGNCGATEEPHSRIGNPEGIEQDRPISRFATVYVRERLVNYCVVACALTRTKLAGRTGGLLLHDRLISHGQIGMSACAK